MKKVFLFILVCIALPVTAQDKDYFRSNSIGMLLEELPWYRLDEFDYILQRTWEGGTEIRRLIQEEKELKRWERSYYSPGKIREEKEFKEEELVSITLYNQDGSLSEQSFFSTQHLDRRLVYQYAALYRIDRVTAFNEAGELLYTDIYSLTPQGAMRRIKRQWADNHHRETSLTSNNGRLIRESHTADGQTFVNHFDPEGNLIRSEIWRGEELSKQTTFNYKQDTSLPGEALQEDLASGRQVKSLYDAEGRVKQDIISENGRQVAVVDYTYSETGKPQEVRENNVNTGLGITRYYYKNDGEPDYEEHYLRGSLDTKIQYLSEDTYFREQYNRNGEAVIRIYYRNDVKYKEELLENDEVIKTRTFE